MTLRDGRFSRPLHDDFSGMNSSIDVDRRLYRQDIRGSIAYARALREAGVLSDEESEAVVTGLSEIEDEIREGSFAFRIEDEDIHMSIERRLAEKIGPAALKLHTGRSRNEQVVLDERLYLKDETLLLRGSLKSLLLTILRRAGEEIDTLIPAYTHLRPARPVSLAHLFTGYAHALHRDMARLTDSLVRLDVLPLGSGAVGGSTIPVDREMLRRELDFSRLSENSIDAVSARDFIAEFEFVAASVSVTLSRMAEDIILFSSEEFGFFELPDELTTTSSLMPQKKNPDSLELIRGKCARVVGNLTALLTLMKGTPYTYNRDFQEDKEGLFDTADTVRTTVRVMEAVFSGLTVRRERVRDALTDSGGFLFATDIADYLVERGIPFRDAHRIVGVAVGLALKKKVGLADLPLTEYRKLSDRFGEDLYDLFDPRRSVDRHDVIGGTATGRVRESIDALRKKVKGQG
jgi:argininosuccinate lyase